MTLRGLGLLGALSLAACHRRPQVPPPRPALLLLADGSLHGQIEDCGCHLHASGGMARRATAIARLGQGKVALALDSGDALFPPGAGPVTAADRRRADLLAAGFEKMGYAALAVGELDLRDGLPALQARRAAFHLPYVATNWVDGAGKHPFPTSRLVDTPLGAVAVVAVSDAAGVFAGLHAEDPAASLRAEVGRVKAQHPVAVVALVDAPTEALPALLQGSGVDVALVGHLGRSGMLGRAPPAYGTGEKGRTLDAITLELGSGPLVDGNAASDARAEVQILDKLHVTLVQRDAKATAPQAHAAMRAQIALNRKRRAQAQARADARPQGRSISWRLVRLDDAYPSDPALASEVAAEVAVDGHAPGR